MKNAVQNVLKIFGFELHRTNGRGTLGGALQQLKDKGFNPRYVLDGGASDGRWSRYVQRYFPHASYILVEPLEEYRQELSSVSNGQILISALGEAEGTTDFYFVNAFNSTRKKTDLGQKRSVPMKTLDSLLSDPEHTLIKLDLEEMEGPALQASTLLARVPAIIVECTFDKLQEYCALMQSKGFVVYYVCDLNYRRSDGAMSQVDILFVPMHSPLRA